jgi:hypothetical protein
MRARPRPLAAAAIAAAVSAASLPLWASTASAGSEPDESQQSVRTVNVGGVDCQVRLVSYRYGSGVYGSTEVITTADQCRTQQVYVNVEFRSASVAGGGATDLIRTFHGVNFLGGTSASFTMSSK